MNAQSIGIYGQDCPSTCPVRLCLLQVRAAFLTYNARLFLGCCSENHNGIYHLYQ